MDKIKVVYILSYPRSGSTLLGNLLGKGSNGFHIGELERLWVGRNSSNIGRWKCGCGEDNVKCKFWSQIINDFTPELPFRKWLQKMYMKPHSLNSNASGYEELSTDLRDQITKFYRLIQNVSDQDLIIDSSKSLPYLKLLLSIPDIDIRVIRLIRNPRAVVNSRLRKTITRNKYNLSWTRKQLLYIKEAYDWNSFYSHQVHRQLGTYVMDLKYEDLVNDFPAYFNTGLRNQLFEWGLELPLYKSSESLNLQTHTIQGNTSRFRAADTTIRHDSRWKTELPSIYKTLIGMITKPARELYNY